MKIILFLLLIVFIVWLIFKLIFNNASDFGGSCLTALGMYLGGCIFFLIIFGIIGAIVCFVYDKYDIGSYLIDLLRHIKEFWANRG